MGQHVGTIGHIYIHHVITEVLIKLCLLCGVINHLLDQIDGISFPEGIAHSHMTSHGRICGVPCQMRSAPPGIPPAWAPPAPPAFRRACQPPGIPPGPPPAPPVDSLMPYPEGITMFRPMRPWNHKNEWHPQAVHNNSGQPDRLRPTWSCAP